VTSFRLTGVALSLVYGLQVEIKVVFAAETGRTGKDRGVVRRGGGKFLTRNG